MWPIEHIFEINESHCLIFTGFGKCLYRLFRNPVYMLMIAMVCFKMFGAGGAMAFIIKYMETQFYLPTWKANLLLGKWRLRKYY